MSVRALMVAEMALYNRLGRAPRYVGTTADLG